MKKVCVGGRIDVQGFQSLCYLCKNSSVQHWCWNSIGQSPIKFVTINCIGEF